MRAQRWRWGHDGSQGREVPGTQVCAVMQREEAEIQIRDCQGLHLLTICVGVKMKTCPFDQLNMKPYFVLKPASTFF